MKKIEIIASFAALGAAVVFIGGTALVGARENSGGPVVACAGQGQVAEGQGFISGAVDAAERYDLDLSDSTLQSLGTELNERAGGQAHFNTWVWVGRTAGGGYKLNLGQCPDNLPQPTPVASPGSSS